MWMWDKQQPVSKEKWGVNNFSIGKHYQAQEFYNLLFLRLINLTHLPL